jgi:hypothetical protein
MGLTVLDIPSLLGGVSQQPPTIRASDQLQECTNGWASLADGKTKRAPTEHVALIAAVAPTNAYIHDINRDNTERYNVIASNGSIKVYDLSGNEIAVTAPEGWGYLAGITDWSAEVRMITIKDYTFVINRNVTVAMSAVGADQTADPVTTVWPNWAIGQDREYEAFGPGLAYQYNPNVGTTVGLSGIVQSFDKLPTTATTGEIYEVTGSAETGFVSYYVRRNGNVWDETVRPNLQNSLNRNTMPHALVRQSGGSFVFAPFSWAPRRVGDESTNPNPTFVGRTIEGVFLYQNRLSFLTDENVVMSVASEPGNYWRTTVLDFIDSDPISIAATTTGVSVLKAAATFADGILLSSDQTQFSLSNGESGLSAASVAIKPTTNYELNTNAGIASMGSEAYFAVERGRFASIREYTRLESSDATSAAAVTAHVASYIPAGVHKIIPLVDVNALAVLTKGDPSSIYIYQVYWASASEKAQSSWHKWTLGSDAVIESGSYIGSVLFLVIRRGSALFLEKIDLQEGTVMSQTGFQVYIDRRHVMTGTWFPGTQKTRFTLPFIPTTTTGFRLVRPDLTLVDPSTYLWINGTTLEVPGNESIGVRIGGYRYEFLIELSPQYLRDQRNIAVTQGRTQARTMYLTYRNSAYFKVDIAPYGTDFQTLEVIPSKLSVFTGKVVGSTDLILSTPVQHSGTFPIQIFGEASKARVRISNDTHVASTFPAASLEMFYWKRS